MNHKTIIADNPPNDGRAFDAQCARCGSSMYSESCGACGGEGVTAPGELYEQDPLWYDLDAQEACSQCGGDGSWMICCSSFEWCLLHPLPGRIEIAPSTTEWFTERKSA